jgi:hypothetical protein
MKTSSCKSKGRALQKHVAREIAETLDLEEDDVVSRPMGSGGEDIMLSPAARKKFPFSVECKNTKTFPNLEALRQADYNSKGYNPVVCWKPPRKGFDDTIIYMRLDSFLKIWRNTIDREEKEEDKDNTTG